MVLGFIGLGFKHLKRKPS